VNWCVIGIVWISSFKDSAVILDEDKFLGILYGAYNKQFDLESGPCSTTSTRSSSVCVWTDLVNITCWTFQRTRWLRCCYLSRRFFCCFCCGCSSCSCCCSSGWWCRWCYGQRWRSAWISIVRTFTRLIVRSNPLKRFIFQFIWWNDRFMIKIIDKLQCNIRGKRRVNCDRQKNEN